MWGCTGLGKYICHAKHFTFIGSRSGRPSLNTLAKGFLVERTWSKATMLLTLLPLLPLLPLVSGSEWRKDLQQQGFAFPLGKFDPYLTARLVDQVNDWEKQGLAIEQQNSTWNSHFRSDVVMEAATDPQVLDAVQEVVGKDVVLLHTTFFAKYPRTLSIDSSESSPKCLTIIGTHQDRTYWGINPESKPVVSVWVAIDNVTMENGAMQFFPGTHKTKLEHVKGYDECSALYDSQSIRPEDLPSEEPVNMELKPGEYGIFDSQAAHRSGRNTSPHRRIGLTMIYVPAEVWFSETNIKETWRVPLKVRCGGKPCRERIEL